METVAQLQPERLRQSIASHREALLDWDIVVADARRDLETQRAQLRVAVRDRDRTARHLRHLIDLAGDAPAVAALSGAEQVSP